MGKEKLTLRQARLLADLTQEDVAKAMDVSIAAVHQWEYYKTKKGLSVAQAKMIAKLYGRQVEEIVFDKAELV